MSRELTDYYDEEKWGETILTKADTYDRENISIKLLKGIAKPKSKILDVGCGVGFFMGKLVEEVPGARLYGVDYSAYNIRQAKKLNKNFVLKTGNIEDGMPFKDGEFDIVYAAELIEHLVNPDAFLNETNRILKKNGHIIVTTPNLTAWYNRLLMLFGIQPLFVETSTEDPKVGAGPIRAMKQGTIPVGHIRIFTIRAMTDLLEKSGFTVQKIRGAHFASLPKPVRLIDDIIKHYPRMASGMIVVAKKTENK